MSNEIKFILIIMIISPVAGVVMGRLILILLGMAFSFGEYADSLGEKQVESQPELRPYPPPIIEGEVIEDYDIGYNCGQLYDGIENDNSIFDGFWEEVRKTGRAPEHWNKKEGRG